MLDIVKLSRLQFALTAVYHFLSTPLALGMAFLSTIMEMVYVLSSKQIYKDTTKFWDKLSGIDFTLGVATGLTMEFRFGINWSHYSHYVGNIFDAPLATKGLIAFFLESTFVDLSFFGWDRLDKAQRVCVTWLVALSSSLSVLWIPIANGWAQNPIASDFNFGTMRMGMMSFSKLVLNLATQVKFVHIVASGYVTDAMFILGISTWCMLKGRDSAFVKRSFTIAVSFGMAIVLSAIVLGDESGYEVDNVQKTKLAAIKAEQETQSAPAALILFGIPDQEGETNKFAIQIPYALGIIAARSVDTPVIGLKGLMVQYKERIRNGMKAYFLLEQLRFGSTNQATHDQFNSTKKGLDYGLLLKCYTPSVADAAKTQIQQATKDSIPRAAPLHFAFRIMVVCGFLLLAITTFSFWSVIHNCIGEKEWLLCTTPYGVLLPWTVVEAGWLMAEYGRQSWTISGVLPTAVANLSLTTGDFVFSTMLIYDLYTLFLVAELFLMFKFAHLSPSSLGTGRYHFKQSSTTTQPAH